MIKNKFMNYIIIIHFTQPLFFFFISFFFLYWRRKEKKNEFKLLLNQINVAESSFCSYTQLRTISVSFYFISFVNIFLQFYAVFLEIFYYEKFNYHILYLSSLQNLWFQMVSKKDMMPLAHSTTITFSILWTESHPHKG